jgi:hypothetical protein
MPEQRVNPVSEEVLGDVTRELHRIQRAITGLLDTLEPCGEHRDGEACVLGWHRGYHRTAGGVEWLDS